MTYTFVVPVDLLRNLAVIRAFTEESIRSLCIDGIKQKCEVVIKGMRFLEGDGAIDSKFKELDEFYNH